MFGITYPTTQGRLVVVVVAVAVVHPRHRRRDKSRPISITWVVCHKLRHGTINCISLFSPSQLFFFRFSEKMDIQVLLWSDLSGRTLRT